MAPLHVVWFKRDLRVRDHWPLYRAMQAGQVIALYGEEPALRALPDFSDRHRLFIDQSLAELAHDLSRLGVPLFRWAGEVVDALQVLRACHPLAGLWSHEETGNLASYARDRAVGRWCRDQGVPWQEIPQFGVVRRLASRDDWHAHWSAFMASPIAPLPPPQATPLLVLHDDTRWQRVQPQAARLETAAQPGGRRAAVGVLTDFLTARCQQYRGGISSPLRAPTACSRLSPYLAWGNLSVREVLQATRRQALALGESAEHAQACVSLRQFESRLHWHCHFIQKLEMAPALEQHCLHPGYEGLREPGLAGPHYASWAAGETGYPLVDACMAMLTRTGWLNFRMRAMLVSFASYNLWLHWQAPAWHLARLFTDYEPGIHYPQIQMQSGVTGINALRIYNPIKQAQDHDPHGHFVRRWLPALRRVPDAWLFQPWLMPASLQRQVGFRLDVDYPAPIVDFDQSYREAKARFALWRQQPGMREMARQVYERHGSRAKQPVRTAPRAASGRQLGLFPEGGKS
ncbi:cryptochrome/deoxyribodipyrimidine photo-lyase family protein [Chitinimonas sp. BJYL2]|uniref:cryptochrome/deoxyribodipyrimidine photo-lyase family protein n=1 Tax=Chitinimonas sp. BJYL2 TaxID=2976696 RepID=UPI0022B32B14|nr:deoxyribodipyrimidine photo-lyase [Chitinimonas sp. BJYL2]